ncbi:hypothetical protein Q9966_000534 [Columba livia]|nr:hypothetical protein Q9966_000534 [Columba livia]
MHRWRRGIHFFTFYGLKEAGQGDAFYDLPWTTVASWGKAVVELAQEALEQHPMLGVSQPFKSIPGKLNHAEGSATFETLAEAHEHLTVPADLQAKSSLTICMGDSYSNHHHTDLSPDPWEGLITRRRFPEQVVTLDNSMGRAGFPLADAAGKKMNFDFGGGSESTNPEFHIFNKINSKDQLQVF